MTPDRIPTTPRGETMRRTPRWPSASYERGEGLLLTAPSLSGQAVYLAIHVHRGRSYIGWGRQFLPGDQPWWAHYIWWGGSA